MFRGNFEISLRDFDGREKCGETANVFFINGFANAVIIWHVKVAFSIDAIKAVETVLVEEDKESCCFCIILAFTNFFIITLTLHIVCFFSACFDFFVESMYSRNEFFWMHLYCSISMDKRNVAVVDEAVWLRESETDGTASDERFNVAFILCWQTFFNFRQELSFPTGPLYKGREGHVYRMDGNDLLSKINPFYHRKILITSEWK